MGTGLIILGAAALLLLKRKSAVGVGRIKYYKAIMEAQREGVPFGSVSASDLTADDKMALSYIGKKNGYKQGKRSVENGTDYATAVWKYLNAKYKQVAGIGSTNRPYEVYTVVNENGDLIIEEHNYDEHRDYEQAKTAAELWGMSSAEGCGYWQTMLYLADGGKFAWDSKYSGTNVVNYGLRDELFGGRNRRAEAAARLVGKHKESLPEEKKAYRKIIGKNGAYIQSFAESIKMNVLGADWMDEKTIADGVRNALMAVTTKEQAKQAILDNYYTQFDEQAAQVPQQSEWQGEDGYDDYLQQTYGGFDNMLF